MDPGAGVVGTLCVIVGGLDLAVVIYRGRPPDWAIVLLIALWENVLAAISAYGVEARALSVLRAGFYITRCGIGVGLVQTRGRFVVLSGIMVGWVIILLADSYSFRPAALLLNYVFTLGLLLGHERSPRRYILLHVAGGLPYVLLTAGAGHLLLETVVVALYGLAILFIPPPRTRVKPVLATMMSATASPPSTERAPAETITPGNNPAPNYRIIVSPPPDG